MLERFRSLKAAATAEFPDLPEQEEKDFYAQLDRAARAHLQKHAASLKAKGVTCATEVVLGHRVSETADYAKRTKADLIVLTAPAYTRENPSGGLGSMSWKIGVVATCPVLLVK